jgi:hypothetical protein
LSKLANGALPSGITVASANLVDGTIVDADISASAGIGLSKLANGALPSGITVASANIVDGTIVDADVSASAAIALSKLATGALPTAITVASANIVDGTIVDADVSASAAIAGTKVAPNFGSQNIETTGTLEAKSGSVISGASTDAALRVTQTGSGNALLIEDSTNPDGTPIVVDASGNLILGHTATFATRLGAITVTPSFQQIGTAAGLSSNLNARFSSDGAAGAVYFAKSRSANRGEHTIVNAGDQLGNITFGGSDGAKIVEAARITAGVDGTPGTDDMPGRLMFFTTSDGDNEVDERMRITSSGAVAINSVSPPAGSLLHVAGKVTATSFGDVTSTDGLVASVTDAGSIVRSSRASTDVNGPQMDMRKARGTQAAKTVVASGDILGELRLLGYGGTSDHEGARIRATVDGTPGDSDMPTMLQFYTTADGSASVTERMRIKENGRVGINETSPASTLHVAGDLTLYGTTFSATAGAVAGYLVVSINGTSRKIPYHAT